MLFQKYFKIDAIDFHTIDFQNFLKEFIRNLKIFNSSSQTVQNAFFKIIMTFWITLKFP